MICEYDAPNGHEASLTMHQRGSAMLSRLQHYHPDRLSALAFLTLGYSVPGADLNLAFVDATNQATLAGFGYPLLGYWYFNERDDSAAIMDQHVRCRTP